MTATHGVQPGHPRADGDRPRPAAQPPARQAQRAAPPPGSPTAPPTAAAAERQPRRPAARAAGARTSISATWGPPAADAPVAPSTRLPADGDEAAGPARPATGVTIAVLSGHPDVMNWIVGTLGPEVQVHLYRWQERGHHRQAEHIVADLAADDAHVVCICDDVPLELAFGVAGLVDRAHAHMSVILLAAPWPEVWREALRAGVRDVVDPRAGGRELGPSLHRAVERAAHLIELRSTGPAPEPATGKVIVVLSAKGGSGKTMVAANLAAALAGIAPGPVALVDLDVQFGDSGSAFGLVPEHTIAQLALVPEVDPTTLKVFLTPHEPSGAFVLCGAASPEEGDNVTDQHAARVIDLLRRDFACVVVDTAAGIDERTLAALDHATDAVLVATMDVASIRNLGKEIATLERAGLLPASRHFVLNRADARVGIDVADVRAALGLDVSAAIPSSRAVPVSMNQGRPLVVDDSASPAARELVKLAHRFVPDPGGTAPDGDDAERRAVRADAAGWFRRRGR